MTTEPSAAAIGGHAAGARDDFQGGQVVTIASGHFVHDTFSAFLSPLLPLLVEKLSLSLTLAGSLASLQALPALLNPFIGYLADRVSLRYFVILAPAVTATLMSSLGLASSYGALAAIILVAGVSVAAFHAPAPAMVGRISGKQVGKGMSWFMAGGEFGRTVGPLLVVWAVETWTLDGYFRVVALGWTASLILFWRLHQIPARSTVERQSIREVLPVARRLFVPLTLTILLRGFVISAMSVYLPTFMTGEGASLRTAGISLAIWQFAGVGGALVSGPLSDRLGRKPVMMGGVAGSAVFMLIFLQVQGWLLVPVLLGLGFTAISLTPVMLAMVQEHLPEHRAAANGLFVSINFLVNAVTTLLVGVLGDAFGLRMAFLASVAGSLLAIPTILLLPELEPTASDS